jgi:4-amino-4-deoxy-L-arabinose transferase-like glycosyltransferase
MEEIEKTETPSEKEKNIEDKKTEDTLKNQDSPEEIKTEKVLEKRKQSLKNVFSNWFKDPYAKIFLIILIIAIILRFYLFIQTINQPLWWDAAEYLSAAKRWSIAPQMTDFWYYRRGFLWPLISAGFFITGLGEPGIRFITLLFSVGIIIVSYLLIKEMFNKKLALLTSIGLTLSWAVLFFTARPLTYIPGPFFILTSLYFFYKGYVLKQGNKYIYISAVFFGLAIFTRMQNLIFLPIFFVFVFLKEKFRFLLNKRLWLSLLIILLILTPLIVVYWQHYGNPLFDILGYNLGVEAFATEQIVQRGVSEKGMQVVYRHLNDMPYLVTGKSSSFFGGLIRPLFLLSFIGFIILLIEIVLGYDIIFQSFDIQKKLFIALLIVLFYLGMGYIGAVIYQGYMIPVLPFVFLLASFSLMKIGGAVNSYLKINKKILYVIIVILFIAILIPNLIWGLQLINIKKTSFKEIKETGLWIKQRSDVNDLVISTSYPQVGYYSERPTYHISHVIENLTLAVKAVKERDKITDEEEKILKEDLHTYVLRENPRYLTLSIFQNSPPWTYEYPVEYNDTWIPVQAWFADKEKTQAVAIIYENKNFMILPENEQ